MEYSAKILLLGRTGVGKSSFINYFLGKEVAKARRGKPCTQEYFTPYEIADGEYPVEIFDTKGLESLGAGKQIEEIIAGVRERNCSDDVFNWFHTIFYVVSMENRFEDFEAGFVHRLQTELSQHIHMILTHCDTCGEAKIQAMKNRIVSVLGNMDGVEVFEVVCVEKRKRNGTAALPRGREEVSARVFDLLWEDIAFKLSADYARTLRASLVDVADRLLWEMEKLIDDTVNFKTVIQYVKDSDRAEKQLDARMDGMMEKFERDLETVQERTNERLSQILQPLAALYESYRGVVSGTFADNAELDFETAMFENIGGFMDDFDEKALVSTAFPTLHRKGYMDEYGTFHGDEDSVPELIKMIRAGLGDLLHLKKNLKKLCRETYSAFLAQLPSEGRLQRDAQARIVSWLRI